MHEGSVWTINSILKHQLVISEINPCKESSYFPVHKELRYLMKGLINIQNEDNEYFRWCLVRYFNSIKKNQAKITNVDREKNLILKRYKNKKVCSN